MASPSREELQAQIERGEIPLRDLAGLAKEDIQVLEHVGRAAFESRHFEKAIKIFAGLEALEPDRPEHILRRAHAEVRAGWSGVAVHSLSKYLDLEAHLPPDDLARALLLRAQLTMETDRSKARDDIQLVHVLAQQWPEAKKVLEEMGR